MNVKSLDAIKDTLSSEEQNLEGEGGKKRIEGFSVAISVDLYLIGHGRLVLSHACGVSSITQFVTHVAHSALHTHTTRFVH